ncbi:MAG: hypothetical protein ACETVR_04430 [Candidatus Bathyarchaeia archaeon]
MKDIKEIAERYIMSEYGNLIISDEPFYNREEKRWFVNLKSNYPRIIVDDSEPIKRELYFVTLNNLGQVIIDKQGKIIDFTSRKEINKRIEDYLNLWKARVERIIIKASSDRLVFTPTIQHFLTPVRRIVSTILMKGELTHKELKSFPKTNRAYEWVSLLESLDIIEPREKGYSYGNMWSMLYENADKFEPQDVYIISTREILFQYLVMSNLLQERFPYIKDIMNLRPIRRILNVNNSYYKPCIEAEKILKFKPKTVLNYYNTSYGDLRFPLISSALMELVPAGILEFNKGLFIGNEKLLEKMLELGPSKQIQIPM